VKDLQSLASAAQIDFLLLEMSSRVLLNCEASPLRAEAFISLCFEGISEIF